MNKVATTIGDTLQNNQLKLINEANPMKTLVLASMGILINSLMRKIKRN